jgi:hypothetical protein
LKRGALAEHNHESFDKYVLEWVEKRGLGAELERVKVIPFSERVRKHPGALRNP